MPQAQGKILINGQNISELNLQSSRGAMSVIPQDPFLFSGELRRNLDPSNSLDDLSLWQALERVEVSTKSFSYHFIRNRKKLSKKQQNILLGKDLGEQI